MKQKLMIVADLGRLKAFRVDWTLQKTPRLEPLEEMEFEEAHRRVLDTVTDMAGRHAAPTQRHWGAPIADVHNLELETRRRLIRRLAKRIEQLIERDGRDGCWLAAHKEINREILDELPEGVRARIEKHLQQDLTKTDSKGLLEQFSSA